MLMRKGFLDSALRNSVLGIFVLWSNCSWSLVLSCLRVKSVVGHLDGCCEFPRLCIGDWVLLWCFAFLVLFYNSEIHLFLDYLVNFMQFAGIGKPPGSMDVKAFLLQKFSPVEREQVHTLPLNSQYHHFWLLGTYQLLFGEVLFDLLLLFPSNLFSEDSIICQLIYP